jgi:hypothetical protein
MRPGLARVATYARVRVWELIGGAGLCVEAKGPAAKLQHVEDLFRSRGCDGLPAAARRCLQPPPLSC